jgi:hypothetical protein
MDALGVQMRKRATGLFQNRTLTAQPYAPYSFIDRRTTVCKDTKENFCTEEGQVKQIETHRSSWGRILCKFALYGSPLRCVQ